MADDSTKEIVKNYLGCLRKRGIPVEELLIFGSRVKGTSRKDSDIDVAVVSSWFNADDDEKRALLWNVRTCREYDIEPHGFSLQDWANDVDPMVHEIKKTGERIV